MKKLFNLPEGDLILIVVNPTLNLGVLFEYLRGFGFRVLVINDGEKALTMAKKIRPDLILLDVDLPGMDGFETCRELKGRDATKNIPVIFVTEANNMLDKIRGFAMGAVDNITRPIQLEEVVVRVRNQLMLKNLQKTLEEKNARLEEEIVERENLIAELDAFSHTVAHDLKTPLSTTISYSQYLKHYGDEMEASEREEYVDIIMQNGQKMSNIIDELLLLASARKEDVNLEPIDMEETVHDVKLRLAYMIEENHAEIILPEEWPTAVGYAPWVEEIWANFVSNAIKYGGKPPRVELGATVRKYRNKVEFWVRDNGRGLTPEQQATLFTPFTRLNQANTDGHGLGLSIVQRIVTKLGGDVGVHSTGIKGEGSVFSFTLPHQENDIF